MEGVSSVSTVQCGGSGLKRIALIGWYGFAVFFEFHILSLKASHSQLSRKRLRLMVGPNSAAWTRRQHAGRGNACPEPPPTSLPGWGNETESRRKRKPGQRKRTPRLTHVLTGCPMGSEKRKDNKTQFLLPAPKHGLFSTSLNFWDHQNSLSSIGSKNGTKGRNPSESATLPQFQAKSRASSPTVL